MYFDIRKFKFNLYELCLPVDRAARFQMTFILILILVLICVKIFFLNFIFQPECFIGNGTCVTASTSATFRFIIKKKFRPKGTVATRRLMIINLEIFQNNFFNFSLSIKIFSYASGVKSGYFEIY